MSTTNKPTFPFLFAYGDKNYVALDDAGKRGTMNIIPLPSSDSVTVDIWRNNITYETLLRDTNLGSARFVDRDAAPIASLQIAVDSSAITSALAQAKELEATLQRIGGMLK